LTSVRQSLRDNAPGPPQEIDALKAALVTERTARQQAEARASGAEAMVAHLKLLIAKMAAGSVRPVLRAWPPIARPAGVATRGAGSERHRRRSSRTDRLCGCQGGARLHPQASGPRALPGISAARAGGDPRPNVCPCCGGRLGKLGEDITETLEVVPRQWKVIHTVREKFICRLRGSTSLPAAARARACWR